jgi:hypothetical protein
VAQQLAQQVGVAAGQVALATPSFTVDAQVLVTGFPPGSRDDVRQGLLLYLAVPAQGGWCARMVWGGGGGRIAGSSGRELARS